MLNLDQFEEILIYFIKSIHEKSNEKDIYWSLAKNCIAKLGLVDCVIYSVQKRTNLLKQEAAYGPKNPRNYEIYNPVSITLGKGISGSVALTGQAEIIPDTTKDPRYIEDDEFRFSEITVPIVIKGKTIGIIDCEHPEKNYFTKQHLRILTSVATICALKIEQLRSEKKARKEQKKALKFQLEMSRLKLKAFHTQMNPHFVFNTFNAIQYFITESQHVAALDYLSTFSKLIRYYLKNIENETISINEEIDMLRWYLKLQKLRYDKRFDFVINTSVEREAVIPAFVLQSLLENCIEYPIFSYKEPFTILLDIDTNSKSVVATITLKRTSQEMKGNYFPAYRKRFADWGKHIHILNQVKKYNIQKKVHFNKLDNKVSIEAIEINLPNLL